MSFASRLYVKCCKPDKLKDYTSGRKSTKEAEEKDKDLIKLQLFIDGSQKKEGESMRELETDRTYSFTLFRKASPEDHVDRIVKVPKGTKLRFFRSMYFTFNEADHSWVVNLNTSEVRYRHNRISESAHVHKARPFNY